MSSCNEISIGYAHDCTDPFQGGIGGDSRLILINKSDLSSSTESGSTDGLITALTLKSGKSAYAFEGIRDSLKPSHDMVLSASQQPMYKHRAQWFLYAYSQVQKNNIEKMMRGRFIAIYQNAKQDANSFEILGLNVGLQATPQKLRDLGENGGAYSLLLETPDNELEVKLPQTFLSTDFATTLTALNALLNLPSITNVSPVAANTGGSTSMTIQGTNFFGGTGANDVSSVVWVKISDSSETNQTSLTVTDTQITFSSVSLSAATYRLKVTTSKGSATSTGIVTVS